MSRRVVRPVVRPVVRVVALLAVLAGVLLGTAGGAQAHAYLVGTNPVDGSTLTAAPAELRLSFSEHVVLSTTEIELVDGDGRTWPVSDIRLSTADDAIEAPSVVVADLPELPVNTYRVHWATLSSDDLHATSGYVVFGVGREVAAQGFTEPAPRVEETALRWLLLLGTALVLGQVLAETRLPADPALDGARRRLRALAWVGALAALVTSGLLLVDQLGTGGLALSRLLLSGYGGRWAVREVGLLLLAVAAVEGVRGIGRRVRRPLLAVGALLTSVGTALLGHAGADPGPAGTRVVATAVHVLAVTTWAGALVCLAILLAPGLHPGRRPDLSLRAALRAFGTPAVTCLVLAAATGIYLASATVVSLDAALATTYGRTLVVKVGLVGLISLVALGNHRRLHGRHDLDLPRRGVAVEATLAVLVLAATGVLTSAQPATEPRFLAAPSASVGPVSAKVADLHQALDVRPNLPGRDVVTVSVFDTRRPSPGVVTGVDVAVGDADAGPAEDLGGGHWSLDLSDVPPGPSLVTVTVHRAGLPDATSTTAWTVATGTPPRDPVVSDAPLAGWLRGLAGLVALLGLWLVLGLGRRRRAGQGPDQTAPELGAELAFAHEPRDLVRPGRD